jgi:hypothetical protein
VLALISSSDPFVLSIKYKKYAVPHQLSVVKNSYDSLCCRVGFYRSLVKMHDAKGQCCAERPPPLARNAFSVSSLSLCYPFQLPSPQQRERASGNNVLWRAESRWTDRRWCPVGDVVCADVQALMYTVQMALPAGYDDLRKQYCSVFIVLNGHDLLNRDV